MAVVELSKMRAMRRMPRRRRVVSLCRGRCRRQRFSASLRRGRSREDRLPASMPRQFARVDTPWPIFQAPDKLWSRQSPSRRADWHSLGEVAHRGDGETTTPSASMAALCVIAASRGRRHLRQLTRLTRAAWL